MARFTYIPNRVIDTNGIADGAAIYVLQSGTMTPVPIYTDAEMTVETFNPFVVAAGARVPELFYAGAPSDIRVRIVASDGEVISDDDPYSPPLLESDIGSVLVFEQAGAGAVSRTIEQKLRDMPISPMDYGAAGDGVTDDTQPIRDAIAYAASSKRVLDLTGGTAGWRISGELDLTNVPVVNAAFDKPIIADVTGSYSQGYAVRFGNPAAGWVAGRANFLVILGSLTVNATSRDAALHGVYLKGSFQNIGTIRVAGFNGMGVYCDSVWDSLYGRISVELCGSATHYALRLDSSGDTTNATHWGSIQCEQAFNRGIYANVLRCVIDNIHSERLAITDAGAFNHHVFLLSNSSLNQAVLHCSTSGTAPGGVALVSTEMKIRMAGDLCSFSEVDAEGASIVTDFGTRINFRNIVTKDFRQSSPSGRVEMHLLLATGTVSVENDTTLIEPDIATFSPLFNARNIIVNGGRITNPLNFTAGILGNIVFNNVTFGVYNGDGVLVGNIGDTRSPDPGYLPTTFRDCAIGTFSGSFQARAVVAGGHISTIALVTRAAVAMRDLTCGTFGYTGETAFITRGVRAATVLNWTTPTNYAYPAGTITERVGYDVSGKIYQNTDGATAWAKIA